MKKIFFFGLLAVTGLVVKAQQENGIRGFKIGAGANLAVPVSNLPYSSIGAGIDLLARFTVSDNLALTADAGYTALFGKDNFVTTGIIPIRVGFRYLPVPEVYLGAKAGLGIYTLSNASTNFTAYSIGAGYQFSPKMDIGAAYDGYTKKNSSFGYFNLRLGYTF